MTRIVPTNPATTHQSFKSYVMDELERMAEEKYTEYCKTTAEPMSFEDWAYDEKSKERTEP